MVESIIYIISAPSGAGKSSLIRALINTRSFCNTKISISHTTRKPRPGEINGQHYFFVNYDDFQLMIEQKLFIEYAKVFNNYYGTSRKYIEQMINNGSNIILDIDWQGAKQVREKIYPVSSIFILPPSKVELYKRLSIRGQDKEDVIIKRMKYAVEEMSHYIEYDYLIINDIFNIALQDLQSIIHSNELRMDKQKIRFNKLIQEILT